MIRWLERRANGKLSQATMRIPAQVFEQERYGHLTLGVLKKAGFTPFTSVQTSREGNTCTVSVEHNSNHDDTYTEFWQNGELKLKAEGSTADFIGACDDIEALAYVQDHKGNPVKQYKRAIPGS